VNVLDTLENLGKEGGLSDNSRNLEVLEKEVSGDLVKGNSGHTVLTHQPLPLSQLFCFKIRRNWYAYFFLKEAEEARQYFVKLGHTTVGEILELEALDFKFRF